MSWSALRLANRTLVPGCRPYVIAEIGVNHGGSLAVAKTLIDLAREGGADAAKFQTYKAQALASAHSPAYWDRTKEPTSSQRELFAKYDMFGPDEYRALAKHCADVGVDFVSTPFDLDAVDFLDSLMPFYKVASADVTNVPLLRAIARKHKPVVMSTGASTITETQLAVDTLMSEGCREIALLHCVLNYPTPDADAHLRMIQGLQVAFPNLPVGYSDHTLPDLHMTSLVAAAALGAVVLEKHFTHDRTLPGNDHYHAMDVDDLKRLTTLLDRVDTLLGPDVEKKPLPSEEPARQHARRSIVLAEPVAAGAILSATNLTTKRPAHGVGAEEWDRVVGRRVTHALADDHVLQWSDLEVDGADVCGAV